MAQRQKAPPEQRRSEVTIPRLTTEEIQTRAGRAFDSAVSQIIRDRFSRPPSRQEMASFNSFVQRRLSEAGRQLGIDDILGEYSEQHPDSTIARYFEATNGDTAWIFDEERGRVRFSAAGLSEYMTRYFQPYRQSMVSICATLGNPNNRSHQQDVDRMDEDYPGMPRELVAALQQQFTGSESANRLAIDIQYVDRTRPSVGGPPVRDRFFAFTNLQPAPDQEMRFKGKRKG